MEDPRAENVDFVGASVVEELKISNCGILRQVWFIETTVLFVVQEDSPLKPVWFK